jgi:hypothetical protein
MISNIFRFYTERRLVEATGLQAHNLRELYNHLKKVGGASVFYHTHASYLEHHFVRKQFYNDFASWIYGALQEHELAEKIVGIDMMEYTSIRGLREAILDTIQHHLGEHKGERTRKAPEGETFYFCKAKSFVFPTGHEAATVDDFFTCLKSVSPISIYFHVFESRLRLQRTISDFAVWLTDVGAPEIAEKINKLDFYAYSLDELRTKIISFQ